MLKHILLTTSILAVTASVGVAADLPSRVMPPAFVAPLPSFTWTGFYFGVNAGYAFSDNNSIRTTGNNGPGAAPVIPPFNTSTVGNVATNRRPGRISSSQDGFTGGGGIGYNYQFGAGSGIVVGFEADIQYTDLDARQNFLSALNDPSTFRQSLDYLGTLRGRVGYASDRFLIYGTGGLAYGNVTYDAQFFGNSAARPLAYSGRYDGIETGYVYGGGVEYALPTNSFLNFFKSSAVTLKAEYLRYDLGTRNVRVNSTGLAPANGSYTSRFDTEGSLARAGLNFKFGSN